MAQKYWSNKKINYLYYSAPSIKEEAKPKMERR